jgi:hypothetical protein
MRKLRILFIVAGLVGAFYLNGAGSRVQASPGAAALICYPYIIPTGGGCAEWGHNCENGGGYWCSSCDGVLECYSW